MSQAPAPILLIDDNLEDIVLTQELLRKAGIKHPVLTAPGGEEGIRFLRDCGELLPAFVLCDLRMPKVDGFDVLRWVRNQPRLADLYFAIHTGGDVPKDRARATMLGASKFLVKFPTRDELRAMARAAKAGLAEADRSAEPRSS